jgi:predicted anti-sigma-YlaC factor YlaD
MDKLLYSCRKASELASRAMEEPLPPLARARLRMHHLMCSGCRNFARQIAFLRRASRKLPTTTDWDAE